MLKKTPHTAPSVLAPAKEKNPDDETGFVPDALLSMRDLYEASLIPVWDQHGKKIQFGKLFEDQVTIVVSRPSFLVRKGFMELMLDCLSGVHPPLLVSDVSGLHEIHHEKG